MKELSCKTRGNSSPQGKQRVYFACHPDDFDTYFEPICGDIFKTQNCAIYYDPNPEEPWDAEDMSFTLSEIKLFVFPITYNFLYKENAARTVVFRFAIDNQKPILPLMMEDGLGEDFNNKCEDLQYLDKGDDSNNLTGLSYEQKLKNFLESVLVGDEMAEKVRAAFDAYIFLSYRKKDREYAQQLMKLIHKNDFCRDIAIWYDEFLIPGRNFNDAIQAAMDKSKLFTFVVTPNLLEPDNYVMREEYPRAKKSGKPMLSAEMEPTDHAKLQKEFAGMDPMDATDSPALSAALKNELHDIAISKNDKDPEHNFFIGLAYLAGIDVEQDYDRAVALITGAADAGLPEAMDKLAQMYKYGDGVGFNEEKSAQWQEKLAEYWEGQFEGSQSQEDGDRLFEALRIAGNARYDMSKMELTRPIFEKMMSVSQKLVEQNNSHENRRKLSLSYNFLSAVFNKENNPSKAKEYCQKSLELRETLMKETSTVQIRRDLSISYKNLGFFYEKEGNLPGAKEYFIKAMKLREALVKESETDPVQSRDDLAKIYSNLGNLCKKERNLPEAEEYLAKALELRKALVDETGTAQSRRELSVSYRDFALLYEKEKNPPMAKEYYIKALELRESLMRKRRTAQARRDLSVSYRDFGLLCKTEGKLPEAKEYYIKALELRKALMKETDTVQSRRDLSAIYRDLENLAEAEGYFSDIV